MPEPTKIRALFCAAVLQNFFDLPGAEIPAVLKATGRLVRTIREMPGVDVLGTFDDDETMVGTSPSGWPWTFYILADVPDRETAVAICRRLSAVEIHSGRSPAWPRIADA